MASGRREEDREWVGWKERERERDRERERVGEREPTLPLHVVLCKHFKGLWPLISGPISVESNGEGRGGEGKGGSTALAAGQVSCPLQLSVPVLIGNLYPFFKTKI